MSSIQSRSIAITYDNCQTYYTSDGNAKVHTTQLSIKQQACLPYASNSTDGWVQLNSAAMSVLYPNATAHPTSCYYFYYYGAVSCNNPLVKLMFNGTQISSGSGNTNGESKTDTISDTCVTTSTMSSVIKFEIHRSQKYLSYVGFGFGDSTQTKFTLYFTRYDFSATAGSNVSTVSVSSSTGYDGDEISFRCVLADGAVFDGWYDGSTRVSTSQIYTMTVSGADKSLQARATMPVTTKTLSAVYNGSQISGYPKSVQSAVSLSYGGTSKGSIPLSGGTKTFSCGGKITNGTININGTNLNNSGKLMATDVVVTVS